MKATELLFFISELFFTGRLIITVANHAGSMSHLLVPTNRKNTERNQNITKNHVPPKPALVTIPHNSDLQNNITREDFFWKWFTSVNGEFITWFVVSLTPLNVSPKNLTVDSSHSYMVSCLLCKVMQPRCFWSFAGTRIIIIVFSSKKCHKYCFPSRYVVYVDLLQLLMVTVEIMSLQGQRSIIARLEFVR